MPNSRSRAIPRSLAALVLWSCAGLAQAAQALDPVPGGTLLFPYFEVDLDDPANGANTTLSWHGSSAVATLTHVTVWSDYGLPVLSFNVYLTGLDVVSLDLRALLVDGRIPRTATAGQDPDNSISPKGLLTQDINFASCGEFPYTDPALTPAFRADLQSALTGGAFQAQQGRCMGAPHGDHVMRGYVTVDSIVGCTQNTPRDAGYENQLATQNQLTGEYLLANPAQRSAVLLPAAALEADSTNNEYQAGDSTFYGTWNGFSAQDKREPLPTTWAAEAQAEGTEVIVWRDHKRRDLQPFACSAGAPAGFPLGQERVFAFDNEERPTEAGATPFPLATQRVTLGSAALPAPARPGWLYLGLGHQPANPPSAPSDTRAAQALVVVLQRLDAEARSGATAHPLDGANDARHTHPN